VTKTRSEIRSIPAKAITHPIRLQALTIFTERVASPAEIARDLGEQVGNVSYHVRELEKLGMIELVRTRKVRGAVEHFYRASVLPYFDEEEWAALPPDERGTATLHALRQVFGDVLGAMEAGTFDARPERCLVRIPGLVDELGWTELNALHAEATERTFEILARSAERMVENPEAEQIPATSVMIFFERPGVQSNSAGT
jgi:DNA-binding transcriptional ArsR family regulator